MTATDSTAEPPPAEAFYDARRDVYYTKPTLRGWLHLLWFEVSLVFGTLLLARAHGGTRITASAIYVASVSGMFGISALYHRGNWSGAWRQRLQRLDHAMIFFLIAGTATPAFLLTTRSTFGLVCLIVMWALTAMAAAIRMARMGTPELVAGTMFVGLGWLAGLALPWVWASAGVTPAVLMLTGGLLYTAGALSYHRRRPDPLPSVFGYHEVFHAFVCAAATCQFAAIALFHHLNRRKRNRSPLARPGQQATPAPRCRREMRSTRRNPGQRAPVSRPPPCRGSHPSGRMVGGSGICRPLGTLEALAVVEVCDR